MKKYFVPIIGTISSGKTTFLKGFLGIDILETGSTTTTKFVCLIKNSDKTIVIVSHSLESVKKLCNRAIWLNQGEVKMDGETSKVIEEYLKVCG